MTNAAPFLVHGLTVSYFTRKVTGYLDYKGLAWRLQPTVGLNPEARAAGWNGGIPFVATPEGELIWDSTALILHLEQRYPDPAASDVRVPRLPARRLLRRVALPTCGRLALALRRESALRQLGYRARGQP